MMLIIGSLAVGILLGYLDLLPKKINQLTNYLTLGGLFLLLFTMGLKVGVDEQIVSNLDKLGFDAIILALGSVIGSVILLLVFEIKFNKEE